MALQQEVRDALKTAMKEKDQTALDTLRGTIAAFTNEAVNLGKSPQEELSDEQALTVIKRQIKQRKDAIAQYTAAGRADLLAIEEAQVKILEQYVPAQMSEEAIREIAMRKKEESGIADKSKMGMLVGAVMKEVGSNADGAVVKKVIESLYQ